MPRDDSPQTMLQKLLRLTKDDPSALSAYQHKFVVDLVSVADEDSFQGFTLGQVTYLERLYFNFFQ